MKKKIVLMLAALAMAFSFALPASAATTQTYNLNGAHCFWGGSAAIKIKNNTGQQWSYYIYQDFGSVWWGPQGTQYGYAGTIYPGQTVYFVYSGYSESYSFVLPPGIGNYQNARISLTTWQTNRSTSSAFSVTELCY